MRRIETSISCVQAGMSSQASGMSSAHNCSPLGSTRRRARRPRVVREHVEVARLPVQRLGRDDPHDLVAVPRPGDRAVALRPREAHGVVGPEALGERAVVEPGLAAVGGGRDRQRTQQRDRDQAGDAEPGPQRQALQPQEDDRQRGQHEAEQQRGRRTAQRDDRRGDEHQQHGERRRTGSRDPARSAARARPASCPAAARRSAGRRGSAAPRRAARARRAATGRRSRRAAARCPAPAAPPPSPDSSSSQCRGLRKSSPAPESQ